MARWNEVELGVFNLQLNSSSKVARQRTAYVLRNLALERDIPAETFATLQESFQSETVPAVKTTILAALFVASKEDRRADFERLILDKLTDASPAEKAELISVLPLRPKAEYRPVIAKYVDDPAVEIRIAAIVALYRLDSSLPR